MVEESGPAREMVLCAGCSDVVPSGARCPTCGADPRLDGLEPPADVDEALLEQVGVALAAQAALAQRTAARRVETASRLFEEAVALRSRLRRQAMLLRARVAERTGLLPGMRETLDQVEGALVQTRGSGNVGGPWRLTAALPRNPSCPTIARRLLEEYVREELGQQQREDAILIASELVTNAFVHGDGEITFIVSRVEDRLRIEVLDEGHPARIDVVPEQERDDGGRGLWAVQQLASDWGAVDGTGHVWAELKINA
jgi:anti-sigma regulatory factor (Ser/Thr protein kinase)